MSKNCEYKKIKNCWGWEPEIQRRLRKNFMENPTIICAIKRKVRKQANLVPTTNTIILLPLFAMKLLAINIDILEKCVMFAVTYVQETGAKNSGIILQRKMNMMKIYLFMKSWTKTPHAKSVDGGIKNDLCNE